jgi:hypothetical protein
MNFKQLTQDVIDGNESALKAYGLIKDYSDEIKKSLDIVKEAAIQEASLYEEKTFKYGGFKFEKRAGGQRFDFSQLSEWKDHKKALKDCEDRYKAAYAAYKRGVNQVSSDGEILEMPIVKNSPDTIVVKKIND